LSYYYYYHHYNSYLIIVFTVRMFASATATVVNEDEYKERVFSSV